MKQIIKVFIVVFALTLSAHAADMGPNLSGLVEKVLNLVDDGRWSPGGGWYITGLQSSDELKTNVVDGSGKTIAAAVWPFEANYDEDRAKVGNYSKLWPTENYDKLQKLAEGDYTLQYFVNGKVVWETPFHVSNVIFKGKDHYRVTGFWNDLAYFYVDGDKRVLCFWIEGPTDFNLYNKDTGDFERVLGMQLQIEQGGKIIAYKEEDNDHALYIYPGKVTKYCASTYGTSDEGKTLSADGEYDVLAYLKVGGTLGSPLVKLKVTIKDGKVVMNDELTGAKADPKRKIITDSSYYNKNLLPVNIPPKK